MEMKKYIRYFCLLIIVDLACSFLYLTRELEQRTCKFVYTNQTDKTHCDGWNNIELSECKQKCAKNDVPPGCDPPSTSCFFVIWRPLSTSLWTTPGHCHLATIETCDGFVESPNFDVYFMKSSAHMPSESSREAFKTVSTENMTKECKRAMQRNLMQDLEAESDKCDKWVNVKIGDCRMQCLHNQVPQNCSHYNSLSYQCNYIRFFPYKSSVQNENSFGACLMAQTLCDIDYKLDPMCLEFMDNIALERLQPNDTISWSARYEPPLLLQVKNYSGVTAANCEIENWAYLPRDSCWNSQTMPPIYCESAEECHRIYFTDAGFSQNGTSVSLTGWVSQNATIDDIIDPNFEFVASQSACSTPKISCITHFALTLDECKIKCMRNDLNYPNGECGGEDENSENLYCNFIQWIPQVTTEFLGKRSTDKIIDVVGECYLLEKCNKVTLNASFNREQQIWKKIYQPSIAQRLSEIFESESEDESCAATKTIYEGIEDCVWEKMSLDTCKLRCYKQKYPQGCSLQDKQKCEYLQWFSTEDGYSSCHFLPYCKNKLSGPGKAIWKLRNTKRAIVYEHYEDRSKFCTSSSAIDIYPRKACVINGTTFDACRKSCSDNEVAEHCEKLTTCKFFQHTSLGDQKPGPCLLSSVNCEPDLSNTQLSNDVYVKTLLSIDQEKFEYYMAAGSEEEKVFGLVFVGKACQDAWVLRNYVARNDDLKYDSSRHHFGVTLDECFNLCHNKTFEVKNETIECEYLTYTNSSDPTKTICDFSPNSCPIRLGERYSQIWKRYINFAEDLKNMTLKL